RTPLETSHHKSWDFDNRHVARAAELSRDRSRFGEQHFGRAGYRKRVACTRDLSLSGLFRRTCDYARVCSHPFSGSAWIVDRATARTSLRFARWFADPVDL